MFHRSLALSISIFCAFGVLSAIKPVSAEKPAVSPVQLNYLLKSGQTRKYFVTAYFDGNFPPFDQPGDPPVHLLARMVFTSHTGVTQPQGTTVDFKLISADLELLSKQVPTGAVIKSDDITPFPIEPEQAQAALDSSVSLRPDGSIVKLLSNPNGVVRINIGFDLRKLFLMMMPVIFPTTPVGAGSTWTSSQGVIGSPPINVHYTNTVKSVSANGSSLSLIITQNALSNVTDTLDSSGNSTQDKSKIANTLKGTVSFKGVMHYLAHPSGNIASTQMTQGNFLLQVKLTQAASHSKQPAHSKENKDIATQNPSIHSGNIDVTGRVVVKEAGAQ